MIKYFSRLFKSKSFDSASYWHKRYMGGGNSGAGSYNKFAEFKADVINNFVKTHNIQTVIELGCGDGNQLSFADYPSYAGFDISEKAINICTNRFANDQSKTFHAMEMLSGHIADLSLSLDVIYHLTEDPVFDDYMHNLFSSSKNYVIIYSSNTDESLGVTSKHVRHRKFTNWVERNQPDWSLIEVINNKYPYNGNHLEGSFSDFYFYQRIK